jgi:alpha-L-fucosidase
MASKNDITGDVLQSRMNSKQFEENFDRIFRSNKPSHDVSPHTHEYEYELNKSTGEVEKTYSRIDVISQNGNEGLHYPESLEQGTSKPNGEQFGNESDSTES